MGYQTHHFGYYESVKEKNELLKLVNEAIKELLSGGVQSYTIGKRSLTRLNLNDLYKFRKNLQNEIGELETQPGLLGNVKVAVFDRR